MRNTPQNLINQFFAIYPTNRVMGCQRRVIGSKRQASAAGIGFNEVQSIELFPIDSRKTFSGSNPDILHDECLIQIKKAMSKTFNDLYNESKSKPTPAQEFVALVARITHRSEFTVRMWLSGQQVPDALVQSVIAEHFGVAVEGLFPVEKGGEK